MLDTDLRPRSTAVPLGHKLIAVIIAVAAGWGVYSWFSHRAMQSAHTAGLSFDPAAARSIDPGLADAREPAAALAQSILNDAAVSGLSKQAFLASSAMSSRIGEFRSRLELTQPSARVLNVRFLDTDPARSREAANAVAKALAAWTPSSAAAAPAAAPQPAPPVPAPAATAAPSASSPAAAAKPPSARPAAQPDHSLSDALGALEAELAATNRQLDRVAETNGRSSSGRRSHAGQSSSYNQARQQQLLRNEVKAAQKKLDHLQVQYANVDPAAGVAERLTEIRHALASVWPASNAGGRGFNAAGVSAGQLRRERAELSRVVAVVDRERHAIQRAESAQGVTESDVAARSSSPRAHASAAASSTASPSTSATGSAAPAPAATPAPTPAPAAGSVQPQPASGLAAGASSTNPLRLVRLASSAPPVSPWPAVGAGVLCCLLYLAIAKWRYRHVPADDYIVEGAVHRTPQPQRFITPNEPVQPAEPSPYKVAEWSGIRSEPSPAATAQRPRALFTFEPAPPENAPARVVRPEEDEPHSPSPVQEPHSFAPVEEPSSPSPAEEPHAFAPAEGPHAFTPAEEPLSPSPADRPHSLAAAEEPRSLGPVEQPRSLAPVGDPPHGSQHPVILNDSAADAGDPVADRIRKAFSEGSIRTLFEEPAIRNFRDAADRDEESPERSAPPDRLAG